MITATKNGITRNFSEYQWSNMPKDKFGWTAISDAENPQLVDPNIIQKKMTNGAVTVEKVVPDEIVKPERHGGLYPIEQIDPLNDIPEIKRRPGRQKK